MELYERLLFLRQDPAKIAAGFAEYMRFDPDSDRAQITEELTAILKTRSSYKDCAKEIERERVSPWDDFGGTPTKTQLETWLARMKEETEENLQHTRATIAALDALFCEICRALDAEGLTLTGGQISAIKRAGLPDTLTEELEAIKREHLASIPEAERLDERSAATLYNELARYRLISGPYTAFSRSFGQITKGEQKTAEKGLKWTGNKAEFAYFARRYSEYTQPGVFGFIVREKALCRAFGFDDRQRVNTIRPYLSGQHIPKGSANIDAAFAVLKNRAGDMGLFFQG